MSPFPLCSRGDLSEPLYMTVFRISAEAHDDDRNVHRVYTIAVGQDLFDDWVVEIRFGRKGTRGRDQVRRFASMENAQSEVRRRLRRRVSAPKRIGVSYQVTQLSAAPGFATSHWIPREIIAA